MTTPIDPIREALKAFPEGWECSFIEAREEEFGIVKIGHPWESGRGLAEVITVDTQNYYASEAASKIAAFIMACNPKAIAALLAMQDAHLAEIEALKADAERYRWLIRTFEVTRLPCMLEPFTGEYVADGKEAIDAAIDDLKKGTA